MRLLKTAIKRAFKRIGYDIVPAAKICEKPFNLLSFVVSDYIRSIEDFNFIQVGANNGIIGNDPIRSLVQRYHLTGLLVEPMPDFFEELKVTYKNELQLSFENCAIGQEDGQMSLYRFRRNSPVPKDFFHGLASFNKEYILTRAKKEGLEEYVEELIVPVLSFESIMHKHGLEKVSLLQVDTEGYDYKVLKSVFAASVLPEIINYEWTHLSREDRYQCKCMLLEKGYSSIDVGPDTLAVQDYRKS